MKAVFNTDKFIQKDFTDNKLNYEKHFKSSYVEKYCSELKINSIKNTITIKVFKHYIRYDSLIYLFGIEAEANPCHRLCMEVRGQPAGVNSFPSILWIPGIELRC